MKIRYVGNKPFKTDTVAFTGLTWKPGESLEVDDSRARILLQYPEVWQAGEGASPLTAATTEREALLAEAEALGIKIVKSWTNAVLQARIDEARAG